MDFYRFCLNAWVNGYASAEKIRRFVNFGKITEEQYQQIISTPKR